MALFGILLIVIVALYFVNVVVSHILTWYYFARYDRLYPFGTYAPPVSIIKPTRGVDHRALDNFRSFCDQDYPSEYEIIFCVEDQDDPSIPVIRRVIEEYPDKNVRLIFSDPLDPRSSGKVKNMIAGLSASHYDVVVFADSDVHAPPAFLKRAVACVEDRQIGLAFAAPAHEGAEEWAAALLNISRNEPVRLLAAGAFLGCLPVAVGMTMVLWRDVIEEIGGLEQFGHQVADDIALAKAIRQRGYRIHLLRQPARVFHARDDFLNCWSSMVRWRVILRHYTRIPAWLRVVNHSVSPGVALPGALSYWVMTAWERQGDHLGPLLFTAVLLIGLLSAALINGKFVHDAKLWRFLWVVPIWQLLMIPLLIHSSLTNQIVWRGQRARINPDCTIRYLDGGSCPR